MFEHLSRFEDQAIFYYGGALANAPDRGFPKRYFTCSYFFHDQPWEEADFRRSLRAALTFGAVSLFFHGRDSGTAEHIANDLIHRFDPLRTSSSTAILATSHEGETMADVIDFALIGMVVSNAYQSRLHSAVFLSCGTVDENDEVERLLTNVGRRFRHPVP